MTTLPELFDLLHRLGAWSAGALWLPLLAWTLATLVALALLRWQRPHPLIAYRARQALLLALPLGLALAAATDWALPLLPATPPPAAGAAGAWPPASAPATPLASQDASLLSKVLSEATWKHALGLLTLVGALLAAWRLGRLAVSAWRVACIRHALSGDVPAATRTAARRAAQRLGVRRSFRVAHTSPRAAPMTLGALRPVIALPPGLAGERLEMALAHELVHLRRRDDYAAWAEALAGALFFAHPLCAFLRRQIAGDREAACDAAVLDDRRFSPHCYAQMLLDLATAPRSAPLATPALSLAAPRHSLPNRLRAMKNHAPASLSPRLGTMLAALLLCTVTTLTAGADLGAPATARTAAAPANPLASSIGAAEEAPPARQPSIRVADLQHTASTLAGRVSDSASGEALAGANVVLQYDGGDQRGAATWRGGQFRLDGVSNGTARLQVSLAGYSTAHLRLRLTEGAVEVVEREPGFTPDTVEVVPFAVVEEKPQIRGGQERIYETLEYPRFAQRAGIEGTVILQFTVGTDGAPRDIAVLRSPHETLSKEAVRVLQNTRYEPGQRENQPVPVRMSQPIKFQLDGGPEETAQGENQPQRQAQSNADVVPFAEVATKPTLAGGPQAVYEALRYPEAARTDSTEGTVVVEFVVDEEGAVRDAYVLRGVASSLNQEALRAIRSLTFEPGRADGEPVPVRMSMPIRFQL